MTFLEEIYAQKAQMFLWAPVFIALGVGAYFSLPFEPPFILALTGLAVSLSVFALLKNDVWRDAALIAMLMVVGFCAAQARIHMVHTSIVQKDIGYADIVGTIEAIEDQGKGGRIVLRDLEIERLTPAQTPRKIRVRVQDDTGLYIGARVSGAGKLHAPSAPLVPGGFDFQRYLYFQGIGAVGFLFQTPEVISGEARAGGFGTIVERTRTAIAGRIEAHLEYPYAGIAMALMIGRKTAIEDDDYEAMRHAGLAHMLAISGLHVGLFSGAVFFFVRPLMAMVAGMALRLPIKKYAAVIAIISAGLYMLLAGSNIPTQRAFLMTGIVFLAIIMDRSPISLRLVAFSACAVLLFFPESLMSASFQLSFVAVTCLIMFYGWLRPRWVGLHRKTGTIRRAALYFLGVSLTSVIATFATAPFALFHFQQVALYGVLGNFIAVPLLAFTIMPLVVISLFLMSFGLEGIFVYLMQFGIQAVLEVAYWVSALPHAVYQTVIWPPAALVCIVVGFLWITLWIGRLRFIGLGVIALSVVFFMGVDRPDILVSPDADIVAIKPVDEDVLLLSNKRKNGFVRGQWLQAYALGEDDIRAWPKEGRDETLDFICDGDACRTDINGRVVSFIRRVGATAQECEWVDVLISPHPASCRGKRVIDLFDVKYRGSHAIWIEQDGTVRIRNAEYARGKRPSSGINEMFSGGRFKVAGGSNSKVFGTYGARSEN